MNTSLHRRILRLEATRRDLIREIEALLLSLYGTTDPDPALLAEIMQEKAENLLPERGENA